jgi:hypothetical protein
MLVRAGVTVSVLCLAMGCDGGSTTRTFNQEFKLTLRAGRGELSDPEKAELLKQNHPLLAQMGNPQLLPLMEMFANLPQASHDQLLADSYLKWQLVDLPPEAQETLTHIIRFVIQTRLGGALGSSELDARLERMDLSDVEIGFAVVDLPKGSQKVVSWYAFGAQLPSPVWITIVNSPASQSEDDYVQAHLRRLPLLRPMKSSAPESLSRGTAAAVVKANPLSALCQVSG